MIEWIKRKFVDKDRDAMRSHLRSIRTHLDAIQANIAETHKAEDVVKTDAGKRFLSSIAYDIAALRLQASEALGEIQHIQASGAQPTQIA